MESESIMEIYPGLACIWTKGNPSGLSSPIQSPSAPCSTYPVCVHVQPSTNQSLKHVGGMGVCLVFVSFLVMTI